MFGSRFDRPGLLVRISLPLAALALLLLLLFFRAPPPPDAALIAAAHDDEVVLVAADALHRLSAEGEPRSARPLDALGIESPVVSLSVGLDRLLLVETLEGRLHRCPRDGGGCHRVATGYRLAELAEEEGRIYALSESAPVIRVMELDGHPLHDIDLTGVAEDPAQLLWLGLGHLLVLDRAENRLLVIRDLEAGRHEVVERREPAEGEQRWVLRDHVGQTWAMHGGPRAVLQRRDVRGEIDLRTPWRRGPAPASVTLLADALLLADPALGVWRVELHDGEVAPFGAAALRETLAAAAAPPAYWRIGQAAGFLALLAAALLAFRATWLHRRELDERQRHRLLAMSASLNMGTGEVRGRQPATDGPEIIWLRPSRAFLLQVRLLGAAVTAAAVGYGLWLLEAGLWQTPFLLALLAMLALMGALCLGAGAMRLGSDGRRIHVVDFLGRRASAPIGMVAFRGHRLAVGGLVVPLVGWRGWVFEPARFEDVMAPILPRWRRHMRVTAVVRPWQKRDLVTLGVLMLAVGSLLLRFV